LSALGVVFPQLSFFGPYICRGTKSRKQVALTFDDGPDERSTPALLQLLSEARVAAAFFCIGKRVTANPELARRIVGDGHLLENHTYSHSKATNFYSVGRLRDEIARTQDAVLKSAGVAPNLFRPPMGLSNPLVFKAARLLGLKVIGWTVRGLDTTTRDPERIVARIVRRLKPSAIILLHDGNVPPERLVATVRLLLESLRQRGYEVVRLDKILA
jgi:peptidoglycan/xylan/chitin deacetylase (PgdA/CDA1 family)